MDNWEDALAHREDVLLEDIDLLETFGRVWWVESNYTLEWKKVLFAFRKRDPARLQTSILILIF
jgi:hypothetical protein